MEQHSRNDRPDPSYFAHVQFGQILRSIGPCDPFSLEHASGQWLYQMNRQAVDLVTVARGTGDRDKIDLAMERFTAVQRERDMRDLRGESERGTGNCV